MMSDKEIEFLYECEKRRIIDLQDDTTFGKNLWNYYQFISWAKWFPDKYVELFKNKDSNMQLHFDQRVFMRCDVRFQSMYGTFSRGYAKCITGDSLVFTDKGVFEIGEFFNYQNDGNETHYDTKINVVNRYGKLEKTKLGLYNGKQEIIKIHTNDGFSLSGTKVHKVLIMNKDGNIEFVKTSDIKTGDYILINRNNNVWGNDTSVDVNEKLSDYIENCSKQESSHLKIRKMPDYINEDIARLFGYLVGDGCLTIPYGFIFSNIGDEILEDYKNIIKNYFPQTTIKQISKYDYRTNDKYLRKYLEYLGFDYSDASGKKIPSCILKSSKRIVSSFIKGLFDTDGTVDDKVISFCSVSEKLIKQVQILLLNYGIIARLKKCKTNQGIGYCYKLFISGNDVILFNDEIGFGLDYKKEKLDKLCKKSHNTNKNIIPYQSDKAVELLDSYEIKKGDRCEFYHIIKGNSNLSYSKLKALLDLCNDGNATLEYNYFKNLYDMNYYFSKVDDISFGYEDVYDFHLPDTHSFVSNGFVSHNTYNEVLDDFIVATLNPNITLSVTAQTRENSAALLEDKTNEMLNHYPLLKNEIEYKRFSKNDAIIKFKNGATITNLANTQASKGRRKHRIKIEESALLNNALYEDALEPIVEVPRTTAGSLAVVDPEEMNFQINFFTTSGYRGTDEYNRNLNMINGMRNLSGDMVLGSSWMLPCYYGRGSTKSQILKKKRKSNPIFFAQNYEQKWVGCSNGALVDINKLMATRILQEPILEIQKDNEEYYIGVDVARSENTNNNQSAIVVVKVIRNSVNRRITQIHVVNVLGVTNKMNFANQACLIKKIKKQYRAKMVICDGNGVGSGLIDELLRESYDVVTGDYLGCFDTINTDNKPESYNADKCLFDMKAQGFQTKVVSHFINAVDSGFLKMLIRKQEQEFTDREREYFDQNVLPFVNTELLFFEIANLKLKVMSANNLSVEKVVNKIDKDKFSALSYAIFYILEFCNQERKVNKISNSQLHFRKPKIYNH